MYHLHFHEDKQVFCIIPTGVTITEAHDGVLILSSPSSMFLKSIAIGVNMVAKKH